MPKQKGIIKLRGTVDDLTFYKSPHGDLVKKKGGITKEAIMTGDRFKRTRENMSEFAAMARANQLIRLSTGPLLKKVSDTFLISRLATLMAAIRKLDTTSARGSRSVALGIQTAQGRALLQGFDFNGKAKLSTVLNTAVSVDTATGELTIPGLVPEQVMASPDGATHCSISTAAAFIDWQNEVTEAVVSAPLNLPIDITSTDVSLTPASLPTGTGTQLFYLLIEYFQEVNGIQYPLRNGGYNVLNLLKLQNTD